MNDWNCLVSIRGWYLLGFLALLTSCFSIRPGGAKSGKKLYETFYVGEEGTQYFIKPMTLDGHQKEKLKLDITFRHRDEVKDSAIMNISFISQDNFKVVDSLIIQNQTNKILVQDLKYLFSERKKDMFNCRFSTKISLADVKNLFDNNEWDIKLHKESALVGYTAPKSTRKRIEKLNYEIFALF